MTLETGVKALAEAVAVDVKSLSLNIGNLSQLPTSTKDNLVDSIIELAQSFAELIPQIDDDAGLGDTNVTWSADKSSKELADIGSMIGDVESVLVAINGEP